MWFLSSLRSWFSLQVSIHNVIGQLNFGMNDEKFTNVLLGFNPVELSRDVPVENWNKTFKQVARDLEVLLKYFPHLISSPMLTIKVEGI